jgi:hypothetical protein
MDGREGGPANDNQLHGVRAQTRQVKKRGKLPLAHVGPCTQAQCVHEHVYVCVYVCVCVCVCVWMCI